MPAITETAQVSVEANTLWRKIGAFGAVAEWHPMLKEVETAGNGVGATRTARGECGGEQVERLQAIASARRTYSYTTERASIPVRDYRGEFRIDRAGKRASLVTWSVRFELAEGGGEETVETVRQFLHAGLESLKTKYGAAD